MKRDKKSGRPPAVGKLLRVLVAGGVALAGAASPLAAAADDMATPEKADKAASGKPGAKEGSGQGSTDKTAATKGGDKKDGQKKAASGDEAGGVKGW
jgi:hypothetical protein